MIRERFLSDSELVRLLTVVRETPHVHQRRDHALFALLANTGIRPSEALALTRIDVHPYTRPAWIRVRRMKKRKTVPEVEDIEITSQLAAVLARHLDSMPHGSDHRVFLTTKRSVQRSFKRYARKAGLARRWHLYCLRHTAATRMYVATRDIKMVQTMLGHENPDTSTIYAHVPRALLLSTINTMPVII